MRMMDTALDIIITMWVRRVSPSAPGDDLLPGPIVWEQCITLLYIPHSCTIFWIQQSKDFL
jgi:hypothetical protein